MARIGKILKFDFVTNNGAKYGEALVDTGGGYLVTAEVFTPAGIEFSPLIGDYVIVNRTENEGRWSVVGVIDANTSRVTTPGGVRLYSRDGATVAAELRINPDGSITQFNDDGSITLGADGSITLANAAGSFTLAASGAISGTDGVGAFSLSGGTFTVNGVTIDIAGVITTTAAVNAGTVVATGGMTAASFSIPGGVSLAGHKHNQGADSDGDTQVQTGAGV